MSNEVERVEFTKEMKKDYTILFPNMLDIHFRIFRSVLMRYGYHVEILNDTTHEVVKEGLRYVHNDTCYPALVIIGQMLTALKSGKYDVNKTAVMMFQTGGGCRASNYVYLIRKAVKEIGMPQIPVVSFNVTGIEKNSGFKLTLPVVWHMLICVAYGDLLMLLSNQTRPYEIKPGETDALLERWIAELSDYLLRHNVLSTAAVGRNIKKIVHSFAQIPVKKVPKVKVGIVGEVYVQYSALGNNGLEQFLRDQGCEVMVPGINGFLLTMLDNQVEGVRLYGGNPLRKQVAKLARKYLSRFETYMIDAMNEEGCFTVPKNSIHLKEFAEPSIGLGCCMGEGWSLTAEMAELNELGFSNIVCTQPFGCLPNHIVGKGMIKPLRERFPDSNIVAIDYDPGATKVNQENRIKLMLTVAKEKLEQSLQEH